MSVNACLGRSRKEEESDVRTRGERRKQRRGRKKGREVVAWDEVREEQGDVCSRHSC